MKRFTLITLVLILVPIFGHAQSEKPAEATDLGGTWTIDLRPSPKAEGYYQTFEVSSTKDNKIKGTFYNSKIKEGFINDNWDRIYFAFTTSDGTNDYYHSGYLKNGRLYGISYCPGRTFTAPWNGVKIVKE